MSRLPHRPTPRPRAAAALQALVLLAATAAATAAATDWRRVEGDSPPPRRNAAAIHDPAGDRVLLFGGRGPDGDLADLWAFDLGAGSWSRLSPAGVGPTPRFTHNAVYDPAGQQMLVWSGRQLDASGSTLLNDVWALDLARLEWRALPASTPAPERRYGTAAVFDPAAGELVSFAGFTLTGRFDDTWRFHPGTGAWRDVSGTGARPGERCLHTAAYDPVGHRMLIFGGQRGNDSLDDAWALDLATDTWTQLPSAPQTGGRRFPASAWDPAGERFLVFGGEATDGHRGADLWALAVGADAWRELPVSGPAGRDGAVLVHADGRLLLFGGTTDAGTVADTWILELPVPTAVTSPAGDRQGDGPGLALTGAPNPFNAEVLLRTAAPAAARLTIHDVLGRRVRELGTVAAGEGRVLWDGRDAGGRRAAAGVYLAVLTMPTAAAPRRVVARLVLLP